MRWGGGGLKAAQGLAKATKSVPITSKVGEFVQTATDLVSIVPAIRELKGEIQGLRGGGPGNGTTSPSSAPGGSNDWGPPF